MDLRKHVERSEGDLMGWTRPELQEPYSLFLNQRTGPLSPAMKTIVRTAAVMIHSWLRPISGICNSLLGMRGPWSKVHIHASPECPPKDAAAETRIKSGPTGLAQTQAAEVVTHLVLCRFGRMRFPLCLS